MVLAALVAVVAQSDVAALGVTAVTQEVPEVLAVAGEPGALVARAELYGADVVAAPESAAQPAELVVLGVVEWSACDADVWAARQLQAAMVEQAGRGAPGARVA